MKTNYLDMATRYKLADEYLLKHLPDWKRATVIECRKMNQDSRILDDFLRDVASLAENFTLGFQVKNKVITVKEIVDKKKKPVKV